MSDRPFDFGDELPVETGEIRLDPEESGTLEEVMREALEAIEHTAEDRAEDSTASPQPVPEGDEELMHLRDEVKELRDRSMRTLADFDNFRKRVDRERQDQQRYAGADVLRDILAVVDNLERALEAEGGLEDLKRGVDLILRQLEELMKRHGVERVPSEGQPFDPLVHEAVSRVESRDVAEPTIVRELQSGYWISDRLLRPAMVEVAVPPDEPGGRREVPE